MSPATDTRSDTASTPKPWLDQEQAAEYLRGMGFATVTAHTIKYHATETGKLPRPKRIGRLSYWHRSDLDKLVELL